MKRIILCLLLCLLLPAVANAVSYSIPESTMNVQIQSDGAGLFTDTLVYKFDGSYNGILVTLRHADVAISDFHMYVDGSKELREVSFMDEEPFTYTAATEGDETRIQAYAPGEKGQRTFRLSYRVDGFALRYLDTARINYIFINSTSTLENATVRVMFPRTSDTDIVPFAHGPLAGDALSVQNGVLTLGPGKVPSDKAVEMDILFPGDWIADAPLHRTYIRDEALAVEAEIVERADRDARNTVIGLLIAIAVYAVGSLLCFIQFMRKYGLRHHIEATTDEALLTDMNAAEAQKILTGSVSASGLSATLLELVDEGALTVDTLEMGDLQFTLTKQDIALSPHQKMLLEWLFAGRDTLKISQLDAGENATAAAEFNKRYNEWKARVAKDVQDNGWTFANSGKLLVGGGIVLVAGLAIAFFLFRNGLWPLGLLTAVLCLFLTLAISRIRTLTDTGEARKAALEGFRLNYADKLETNPEAVIGKTPLVMAMGYLQPLADWIDAHPDSGYQDWDYTPIYWEQSGWHYSMIYMDRTVNEAQSHNVGVEAAAKSSSDSDSGGSSGGSGGGSSYGAW